MIVVSGTVRIRPDLRDEAIQKAIWMQGLTQAEPGCISYRFYADLEDPNLFRIFEEWESDPHLQAHFKTAHMAEFNKALSQLVAERPNVTRYAVNQHGPF